MERTQMLCLVLVAFCNVAIGSYQPECQSLDEMISQLPSDIIGNGRMACNKTQECTGLSCDLAFSGADLYFTIALHQCRDPPSMDLNVRSSDGLMDFQRTVSHDDKFELTGIDNIPGLSNILMGMNVYIVTDFQKVDGGLLIGIKLQAGLSENIIVYDQPLIEDQLIPTPPCTARPNLDPRLKPAQCMHMDYLLSQLPDSNFTCVKNDNCMGINCSGIFDDSILVQNYIEIDNCDDPVSLSIFIRSDEINLNWQHKFIGSEITTIHDINYQVELFPVVIRLDVQMGSVDDGYMLTSLKYNGCLDVFSQLLCTEDNEVVILNNELLPVPPCYAGPSITLPPIPAKSNQPHFPTYPNPVPHADCAALDDMVRQLSSASTDGHCYRNAQCTGINCTAAYMGQDYRFYIGFHHCQKPIEMVVAIESYSQDMHFYHVFTHGEVVPIDGLVENNLQVYLQVLMVKEDLDVIVSINMQLGSATSGEPKMILSVPLIENEVIPMPSCNGSIPRPTARPPHTRQPGTTKSYDGKTGKQEGGNKDNKINLTAVIVGVVVAVVIILVLIGAFFLTRRFKCIKSGGTTIILDSKTNSTII
ncbi:uncharacterized protein LOC100378049 [Saccoglossus kowalevskii]